MVTRLRNTWLAGGGALLLVLAISGIAAGAALVSDSTQTAVEPAEPLEGDTDTTLTFEDIDGNGIDDDCQDEAAAESAEAVAAALLAADLDADGQISVSEAAQSGWIGGVNCNHGGYVSSVAHDDGCDEAEAPEGTPEDADESTDESTEAVVAACDEEAADEDEADAAEEAAEAECEAPAEEPAPEAETPVDTAPNAHGKAVSDVAKSDAVGGKNCNHGGAVSEAAKKDHGAHEKGAKNAKEKGAKQGHGKGHNKP